MSISASKVNDFQEQIGKGTHDFNSDTIKVCLTNTTMDATKATYSDFTDLTTGNGYVSGGEDISASWSETDGEATLTGSNVEWTASGGTIGPFRYVVLYNASASNKNIITYWDYGSSITLQDGDKFGVVFGDSIVTVSFAE